ncbi:MAG: hypothetical protein WC688_03175 [Parachlamydiales bacterium]
MKSIDKLKKDLISFNDDWNKLTHQTQKNEKYLKKIAVAIQNLNADALKIKDNETAKLISHMLTTPLGAPFVSNATLFDAALSYKEQSVGHSDLKRIFTNFKKYEKSFNDEISKIFASFLMDLKKQKKN